MSTVTHPPEMREFCSPHETRGRPLHSFQPQTTIPSVINLRGLGVSTITHLPRIQETLRPPLHGLQHQSTIPCQTLRIVVVMVYQTTPSSHKSQYYVPRMGRLVRHCVNCNRTFYLLIINISIYY